MGGTTSVLNPIIERLKGDELIHIQDEFWDGLFNDTPLTYETFAGHLTPEILRDLREKHPKNLATLIRRGVLKLNAAVQTGVASPQAQNQVVNTVRFLTKIVPYTHEDPAWAGFWWTPTPVGVVVNMPPGSTARPLHDGAPEAAQKREEARLKPEATAAEGSASAEQSKEGEAGQYTPAEASSSVSEAQPARPIAAPPLAHTLLDAILALCFAPGFTCIRKVKSSGFFGSKEPQAIRPVIEVDASSLIWYKGVGCDTQMQHTAVMDEYRTDLLRLLLSCLSWPMYSKYEDFVPGDDLWLEYICANHPRAQPLFQSMLNALLGFDAIGSGLPFNYVFAPGAERESLAKMSGELISLMIEFIPLTKREDGEVVGVPTNNSFRAWCASLQSPKDFDFVLDNIARLLDDRASSMPGSPTNPPLQTEMFTIFWKLLEVNRQFMLHSLKSLKLLPIVTSMLYHANQSRTNRGDIGLVNICVYSLLLLSGERNFGVRLNHPLTHVPDMDGISPVTGTHADLLIVVIHNLMLGSNWRLVSLYDCLMTILVNVSPYIRSLGLHPANKLVHMFQVFGSKRFLFSAPRNHHLVFFLLEAFNNMIQYQFDGNQHLVYCIIRGRQLFYNLAKLKVTPSPSASESGADQDSATEAQAAEAGKAVATEAHRKAQAEAQAAKQQSKSNEAENEGEEMPVPAPADLFSPTKTTSEEAAATKGRRRPKVQSTLPPSKEADHFTVADHKAPGFVPTKDWLATWHPKLPLETILRMLQILVPQVEKLCSEKSVTRETEVLEFLKEGTLVGLLPVPQPILTRRYKPATQTARWFTAHVYGFLYLRHLETFHGSNVRLFYVSEKPSK